MAGVSSQGRRLQSLRRQVLRAPGWAFPDFLVFELCEAELGEPFGVGEEVELDDLPVLDRDGGDREGSSVEEG
jgi:hypothetical protein